MPIFEIMERVFREQGFPVQRVGGSSALSTTVAGDGATWPCLAQAVEDQGIFLFYSARPENVAEPRRGEIARLLAALNYRLLVGSFEIDPADGDVRLRTSLHLRTLLDDRSVPEAAIGSLIERSVMINVQTMDRFLPQIDAVASGRQTVEEALTEAFA